jgi:S-phase kinase-associated protein 1
LKSNDLSTLVQPFYANFIGSLSHTQIKDVSSAAFYLQITPLIDLCIAKVASLIRGKTPEEIRANLGLSLDFTPEQEEEIKRQNAWASGL